METMMSVSEWSPAKIAIAIIAAVASLSILALLVVITVIPARRRLMEDIQTAEMEEFTLKEAMAWLKDNQDVLRANPNVAAIVVRDPRLSELTAHRSHRGAASRYECATCTAIFDKSEERITRGWLVYSRRISPDLQEQFGEKDMILFA